MSRRIVILGNGIAGITALAFLTAGVAVAFLVGWQLALAGLIAGGLKTRKSHQRALAGCQRGNPSHTRCEPADKAFARTPGTCGTDPR